MKNFKLTLMVVLASVILLGGCSSLSKSQKGAVIGTTAGGVVGAVVGKVSGNTALGAIIGAAVGGTAGAIIGHNMDKQAEEIKTAVPDANVIRVGEGIVVEFSSNVLFGFDQTNLSSDAKASLDKLIKVLKTYADTDIEIQGHTDSQGSLAYNQALSERRASSVSSYLNSKGIGFARLKTVGFGEELPRYLNSTPEGRARNRRVEFLITANEKMRADAKREAS